jgi:hypothetical protein
VISRCAFTFSHYFDVLRRAKENHTRIVPVGEFSRVKHKGNFILLRHDIDISLRHALRMALLEHRHHIRSTYFVLLHSEFYNALSAESVGIIREISSLGHEIGLHYDTNFSAVLSEEANILSSITGQQVSTIARHNPSVTPPSKRQAGKRFQDVKDIPATYLSDSVQHWRKGCMCNHVDGKSRLQILIHPVWWSADGRSRISIMNDIRLGEYRQVRSRLGATKAMHSTYLEEMAGASHG